MENSGAGGPGDRMEIYKNQAKQIIKKLNPRSTTKMSIESSPYVFQ